MAFDARVNGTRARGDTSARDNVNNAGPLLAGNRRSRPVKVKWEIIETTRDAVDTSRRALAAELDAASFRDDEKEK